MSDNDTKLIELKNFLRLNGNEYDSVLTNMLSAATKIAAEYLPKEILEQNNEMVKLGVMTHVSIMFDMNYISKELPVAVLQFYKPYLQIKL